MPMLRSLTVDSLPNNVKLAQFSIILHKTTDVGLLLLILYMCFRV